MTRLQAYRLTRLERNKRLNRKRSILKNYIAKIPKRHILFMGKRFGSFQYSFDVPHRRIVRRNLKLAYPEWSRVQIQKTARRFFQHFSTTVLELLQMTLSSEEAICSKIRIEGQEFLRDALAGQRGVILTSAHLGNWEMSAQFMPLHLQRPITSVAKKFRNVRFDRFIHHLRTRFGNRILYKKGALPEMMQTLRQGESLVILMDISRRFEGVEVQFFGRRATATPAAALLAIRCKSPVVPIFCHRNHMGNLIIKAERPVEIKRTGNLRSDLQTNTQLITDTVERAVRNYPEQWNWMLKRWKDFYPDLYPESKKRIQRIKKKEKKRGRKNSRPIFRN
jgi:KDO2-lipid IV(A) lauroyltransferase